MLNKAERLIYQKNKGGFLLILLYIALNAVYSIFILNAMAPDRALGAFVMLSIFLLLMGFLIAVKVQIYSLAWSYGAVGMGAFQMGRIFFTTNNYAGFSGFLLNLTLILSGILCLTGGILSVRNTKLRNQ